MKRRVLPVHPGYKFSLDMNGDGVPDTMPQYPDTPFNSGRPTVHASGANTALLDGHAERVPFKKLWAVDAAGFVTHSFWYMEDLGKLQIPSTRKIQSSNPESVRRKADPSLAPRDSFI